MNENKRIVKWNEERQLIKKPDIVNEMSFILEEVIEALTTDMSEDARPMAKKLSNLIASGKLSEVLKDVSEMEVDVQIPVENVVDALGDIKVFATGTIRKLNYDPDLVMDEVLKEIESRKGSVIDGKFVKDRSEEAVKNWYKADFSKATIKEGNNE